MQSFGNSNGNGTGSGTMSAFYSEITSIQEGIEHFNGNVARISELHSRSLTAAASQQDAAQLDEVVAETRTLSNTLKQRIQGFGSSPAPGQDPQIWQNQTGLVRSRFMEAIQNYQQVEQQYRTKYKQRVERQFKIVKPDATPEEVAAVVNDDSSGGNQVFAQALSSSTRYGIHERFTGKCKNVTRISAGWSKPLQNSLSCSTIWALLWSKTMLR